MLFDEQEEACDPHDGTLLLEPTDPILPIDVQVRMWLQEEKERVIAYLEYEAVGSVQPTSLREMAPLGGDRGLLLLGWAAGCEEG